MRQNACDCIHTVSNVNTGRICDARIYFVAGSDVWKRKTLVINVHMQPHKRRIRKSSLWPEFLKTIVFNAVNLRFRVDDRPNRTKISLFCEIPGYVWTRPKPYHFVSFTVMSAHLCVQICIYLHTWMYNIKLYINYIYIFFFLEFCIFLNNPSQPRPYYHCASIYTSLLFHLINCLCCINVILYCSVANVANCSVGFIYCKYNCNIQSIVC